jgi:hypothetical protein
LSVNSGWKRQFKFSTFSKCKCDEWQYSKCLFGFNFNKNTFSHFNRTYFTFIYVAKFHLFWYCCLVKSAFLYYDVCHFWLLSKRSLEQKYFTQYTIQERDYILLRKWKSRSSGVQKYVTCFPTPGNGIPLCY